MQNNDLHNEIFTAEQIELLPVIQKFSADFGLVGGTAVALQIGHRESVDFDLFTKDPDYEFSTQRIRQKFLAQEKIETMIFQDSHELSFVSRGVRMTFYHFPHYISYTKVLRDIITIPDLLTLAAMKAFALGSRAKWKDYVDLYMIMRDHHSLADIARQMKLLFPESNERLFREQLAYFDDINYDERIVWKEGFFIDDKEIKRSLEEWSIQ